MHSSNHSTDQSSELRLLDISLKYAGSIIKSAMGDFSSPMQKDISQQELVLLRAGGTIELHRIIEPSLTENSDEEDEEVNKTCIKVLSRVETRSVLRSMVSVRLNGEKRDVLILGSDSGCVSIIDFEGGKSNVLHCPSFGKTGCRRGTPGQYLAADPKGRAFMISAIEKRKLVYVLNRDSAGHLTIASPLEAHRSRTIVLDTVGIDNGYDNPIFASLEYQYPEPDDIASTVSSMLDFTQNISHRQLVYYELDLGLNHVSRRWATNTHCTAICLAAIHGGADGPGGVLVGGEDWIEYLHESISAKSVDDIKNKIVCAVPRRKLHPPEKGVLITQITVHRLKKSIFFALAQSELGDLYKITLQMDRDNKTKIIGMTISLFDTLPLANSLNVSKLGLLFIAAEFGNHGLYRFERIDVEGNVPTCTSEENIKVFEMAEKNNDFRTDSYSFFYNTLNASKIASSFIPSTLKNLHCIYSMDSLAPITGVLVGELAGNEVSPQIYTLNGRGPQSSIRILRHGMAVTELAVSDLPGVPGNVFTIRDNSQETQDMKRIVDRYIIVSFADATLVLSVGETVEEVGEDSHFVTDAPTLACSALGIGGIVQVHPDGVRLIKDGKASEWKCPGLKRIESASANESQVMITFAGGDLVYFELDHVNGNFQERTTKNMGVDVSCLDVGTVQSGRSRSTFAAVGFRDSTVRILSLEPGKLLSQRSSSVFCTRSHSVVLQYMTTHEESGVDDVILTIGLDDGSSTRTVIDPITGSISASPTRRFVGARPVSVSRICINSSDATLLLSSRPWISRPDPKSGKHVMAPLSYAPLDHGCSFTGISIKEGIVATCGTTLCILSVDTDGLGLSSEDEPFSSTKIDLRYTPRQMCLLTTGSLTTQEQGTRKLVLAIAESDHNDYGMVEKNAMGFDPLCLDSNDKADKKKDLDGDGMDIDSDDDDVIDNSSRVLDDDDQDEEMEMRKTPIRGPHPASPGHWGSCIRLVDPSDGCSTLDCVEMGRNEAALCCTSVRFQSRGGEGLLAVGTANGLTFHPLKQNASHIILYRVVNGERLQLLHRTLVNDGPVLSLAHFQGRLLAGIGQTLRLYEMGKRQLLRKCELRGLPTVVKSLQAAGDRSYVGDMMHSMLFVRYDSTTNRLIVVANDQIPRPVICQELLDLSTIAVGDKFGNISVLRLPRGADAGAVDISGTRALWDSSRNDAIPKLDTICNYHVGEVVTGMTRASLVAGGIECLIYVTITGRIGALIPLTSRDDVDFYSQLERCLHADVQRITGRELHSYRSYYSPVKHVIDGSICGMYAKLSYDKQKQIASRLDYTVAEITKKLEDTMNALL